MKKGRQIHERGVLILGAMKALAMEQDGSRPVSIAPTGAIGTGGLALCDVMGYNYMDPQAEAYHKAHPEKPMMGTETVSAVGTRGDLYHRCEEGLCGLVRSLHDDGAGFGGRLVEFLQFAAVDVGRLCVDGLRLSR